MFSVMSINWYKKCIVSIKERMKEKFINIINVSTIIMYTFVYIIDHLFAVIE